MWWANTSRLYLRLARAGEKSISPFSGATRTPRSSVTFGCLSRTRPRTSPLRPGSPWSGDSRRSSAPTAPGAEQLALDNIATESAIALLGRLPEQQANVILLRVVAGLDTEVIAEMLGTSTGAVRVAAHRGLRKLEAMLTRPGVTSRAGV